MDYTQDERDAMQTADIEAAWIACRMFRFEMADGSYQVVQKSLESKIIVADYYVEFTDNGTVYTDVNAIVSRVGERENDSAFKKDGWLKPKDVQYNRLTHESRIQA